MLALGVLKETNPARLFTPDTSDPIRPGSNSKPLLAAGKRQRSAPQVEALASAILSKAKSERDRAKYLATTVRSSTTLAALAQAHGVLEERDEALIAAREALALSLVVVESFDGSSHVVDATSARLAAEVMLRFGEADKVFEFLLPLNLPQSLRLTLASAAVELGRFDAAMDSLSGLTGEMVESFRGFLLAATGEYQKAIPHLRFALREAPDDADAALNLSVCLWALGSRRKAVATALRASRTAPGRKDLSLHYLELLLESGSIKCLTDEIAALNAQNVVPDSRFLLIQARAQLAKDNPARAIPLLEKVIAKADTEGEDLLRVEVAASLAALRYRVGRNTYEQAIAALSAMLRDYPDHEAVVMSIAYVVSRTTDAPLLRQAVERIYDRISPVRRAFLLHQVAWLEGDNESCGSAAAAWFDAEPANPMAAAAAMVALGIGLERWAEAEKVADFALSQFPDHAMIINNAAYILSMTGRATEAIKLLEPFAVTNFVPRATLGLAYLAIGDLDRGMRLYREAADQAEKGDPALRSLMTTYQAIIVRQLGIDQSEQPHMLAALALAEFPLPEDWEVLPEFVRLRNLCQRRRYEWPPGL
jgi:tetratricopeptide (TPR) repeat protein